MKLKITLATATAMGLLMGTAWATDDNAAYVDQSGTDNSASISQVGASNTVGVDTSLRRVNQSGFNNALVILQSGDGNKAGTGFGGIDQTGGKNFLQITQGDDNTVVDIGQFGQGGAGGTVNTITITQSSKDNLVGNVTQDNDDASATAPANINAVSITQQTGDGNTVTRVEQDGFDNDVTITQSGAGNTITNVLQGDFNNVFKSEGASAALAQTGAGNTITLVRQEDGFNIANVTQTGDLNLVGTVDQKGEANSSVVVQNGGSNSVASVVQIGTANSASLTFNGSDNGVGLGTATGFSGVAAGLGLSQGTSLQDNDGLGGSNSITYTVFGDANLFAFKQDGTGNAITGTVGSIGSDSASNQVAVLQAGNNNTASFSQTGGGNNNLAVSQ